MSGFQVELSQLELGKLYFKVCRFDQAIELLEQGVQSSIKNQDWESFVKDRKEPPKMPWQFLLT